MNQERLKQISIGWRDPLYTLALALGCVCLGAITVVVIVGAFYLIPAIKDWRHANTATTKVYEEGLGSVTDAAQNVKDATAQVAPTLKGLQAVEKETQGYVADLRTQTLTLTNGLDARLQTLDTLLVSVRGVADEARVQLKQNGEEARKTLASLNRTITDVDTRFSKILDDGSLMLETANPKLQELLDHANAVMIDADGTIKSFQPVGVNLAGITSDFNAMTTDSKNKLHEILFPAPKHGWARVGQVATYLLRPIFEGARLYFQLTALPVRITQPIPLGKP
jgi:uncharacterized protein YoxC